MHVLLSGKVEFRNHCANFASDFLNYFVVQFTQVYGETFAVYNVHGLIHLGEDMRFGSSLNGISSFLFENYFQILKKFV